MASSTLKTKLIDVLRLATIEVDEGQIEIVDRGVPHQPKSLPNGMYGIYMFQFEDTFLKIGKVGSKSNARFISQHYNAESSQSNLAKSILLSEKFSSYNLTSETAGEWMKKNLRRIDILIDVHMGVFTLNLIEAFLHAYYEPRFEGYENQRAVTQK